VEELKWLEDKKELWIQYKEEGDEDAREQLILEYLPLVKQVAGRVSVGLPPHVDKDDLIGQGMLGLLDAVEKFDHTKGVKFETYGVIRIRGSMMDGLRKADWVPHSLRAKSREVEEAYTTLENRLGRSPRDEEVAEELDISVEEFQELLSDLSYMTLSSLEEYLAGAEEDGVPRMVKNTIEDESSPDPLEAAEWQMKREVLADAIRQLPDKEKLVITLYYYEGLISKEIAQVMELSPSRISQLHTKAILRLRGRLGRMKSTLVG
jgi:RNA polymerase sigma factor for flagellar operon FliA